MHNIGINYRFLKGKRRTSIFLREFGTGRGKERILNSKKKLFQILNQSS